MNVLAILSHRPILAAVVFYAALKGLAISLVATAFTNTLPGALVIALVSGSLGIVGMVLAAWVTTRAYHSNIRPELRDVKRKVGADRRTNDGSGEEVDPTIKES